MKSNGFHAIPVELLMKQLNVQSTFLPDNAKYIYTKQNAFPRRRQFSEYIQPTTQLLTLAMPHCSGLFNGRLSVTSDIMKPNLNCLHKVSSNLIKCYRMLLHQREKKCRHVDLSSRVDKVIQIDSSLCPFFRSCFFLLYHFFLHFFSRD